MSYSICYLIDIRGVDFDALMKHPHHVSRTSIDEFVKLQEANLWDGMLINCEIEFLVDLTGDWTLCKLPCAYSALLAEQQSGEVVEIVEEWERQLRDLLPSCDIYRIDDFLFDQWNSRFDYRLIRRHQAIGAFLGWLQSQGRCHWARLKVK